MVRLLSQLPVRASVVSPGERSLHLETKTSKAAVCITVELGSQNWFCRPMYSGSRLNDIICGLLVWRICCILLLSECGT